MIIMGPRAGQMTVIVVLVNDCDRWRAVDHGPTFLAGPVDHPVVPSSAADGKVRHVGVTATREDEEITAGRPVQAAAFLHILLQALLPTVREIQRRFYVQIPAAA